MANRITVILEALGFDKGASSVKGFRQSILDADTTSGKFKAGFNSAMTSVTANAGALAVTGGAALVAFGVKAVGAFTDTAKAAIDLGAATGLAREDASRWIAVGEDMGVTAEQLTTSLGKIGKTLDGGSWEKYGIATRDAGGKARSTNEILLDAFDTLGKIKSETERVKVGNELFGKGYSNLAPLIGKTRGEYEDMLGAVEDGQVITEKEAKKAERMRLAQDQLSDAFNDLTLSVGGFVAEFSPMVEDMAGAINTAHDLAGAMADIHLPDMFGGSVGSAFVSGIKGVLNPVGTAKDAITDLVDAVKSGENAPSPWMQHVSEGLANTAAAIEDNADATVFGAEAAKVWTEHVKEGMAASAEVAAENVDQLKESIENSVDQYDAAAAAADRFASANDKVRSGAVSLEEANQSLWETFEAQKQSLADNGATLDISTEKGRENRDAILAQVTAIDDYGEAMVLSGSSVEEATGNVGSMRQALRDQLIQLGYNEDAVDSFVDAVDATPPDAITSLQVADDEKAKEDIQLVLDKLDGLLTPFTATIMSLFDGTEYDVALAKLNALKNKEWVARIRADWYGGGFTPYNGGDTAPRPGGWDGDPSTPYPRALGGPTWPGGIFQYAEKGEPETYTEDGKQYLLPAGRGRVTPLQQMRVISHTSNAPAAAPSTASTGDPDRAAAEAVEREDKIQAAMYETGAISLDAYKKYLEGRKATTKEFEDDWLAIWRTLRSLQKEQDDEEAKRQQALRDQQEAAAEASRDRVKALYEEADALGDLQQAERDVADAQSELNEALAEQQRLSRDRKATDEDRARAADDVANAKRNLAEELFTGAQARARANGFVKGEAGFGAFVHGEVQGVLGSVPPEVAAILQQLLVGLPNFDGGGIVPGPVGAPRLVLAHGQEQVLTPEQQRYSGGSVTHNVTNIYPPGWTNNRASAKGTERWYLRNGGPNVGQRVA